MLNEAKMREYLPSELGGVATDHLWIGGEWRKPASGNYLDVVNPSTGQPICQIAAGNSQDVDDAVAAARASFKSSVWRGLTGAERGRILWRLSDLLEQEAERFARIDAIDFGMPIVNARFVVGRATSALRYYAGICTKIDGQSFDLSGPEIEYHAYVRREPLGVAGLITSWNAPLLVVCNKLAPALAAGCSVVIKPPQDTSLSALAFAKLIEEAGIPKGVVNIVTGAGSEVGSALTHHPDVDKISFTGSTEVGKDLIHASAGNLKRLSLELGGKSPVFVFDDADMDLAIPACFRALFANSGQVCVAGSRLYVQRNSIDRVVSGLKDMAAATRVGDSLDPATALGPLVSQRHRSRVMGYVQSGMDEGAELVAGGKMIEGDGFFMEPTIFLNSQADMKIVSEEIFGPVLSVMPFDDIDDIERLGNQSIYALGSGVFTRDLSTAHRAAKRLEAGSVWVNCYGLMDYSMPFGGFKQSGWGRENGVAGLDAFLESKSVYIRM